MPQKINKKYAAAVLALAKKRDIAAIGNTPLRVL